MGAAFPPILLRHLLVCQVAPAAAAAALILVQLLRAVLVHQAKAILAAMETFTTAMLVAVAAAARVQLVAMALPVVVRLQLLAAQAGLVWLTVLLGPQLLMLVAVAAAADQRPALLADLVAVARAELTL